jgi:DNA-binding transcriptional LysR family regulator
MDVNDEFGLIRVRDLHFFDRLAVLGTITAAAKEMGVPKPTASRWLAQLEDRLGHPLVNRSPRHAALTEHGETFHRKVLEVLSTLKSVQSAVGAEPGGTVRASVPVPLGRMLGGRVIAGFRRKLPGVRLEIALQNHRIDLVRDRFDVAIRGGPLPDSELIARKLGQAPLGLYASPQAPLGLYASPSYVNAALDQIPLLASPGDEQLLRAKGRKFPSPVVVIDDRGALADALIDGAGAGIQCESGKLIRLEKGALGQMPVHALFLPAQRDDPRVRTLIDEVATVLGQALDS